MSTLTRFILGTLFAVLAAGCASSQSTMDANINHSIEFLYFDGCPNTPALRKTLEAALTQTSGSFTAVDLAQLPDDDIRRGYGSPTILINGHELFAMPEPESPSMSCRIYAGGLPNTDTLIAQLSEIQP